MSGPGGTQSRTRVTGVDTGLWGPWMEGMLCEDVRPGQGRHCALHPRNTGNPPSLLARPEDPAAMRLDPDFGLLSPELPTLL